MIRLLLFDIRTLSCLNLVTKLQRSIWFLGNVCLNTQWLLEIKNRLLRYNYYKAIHQAMNLCRYSVHLIYAMNFNTFSFPLPCRQNILNLICFINCLHLPLVDGHYYVALLGQVRPFNRLVPCTLTCANKLRVQVELAWACTCVTTNCVVTTITALGSTNKALIDICQQR